MKVRAKTNIKYGNRWYVAGEEIVIRETDLTELDGLVDAPEKPADTVQETIFSAVEPGKKTARKPRTRAK